jgi:hypothetical protein
MESLLMKSYSGDFLYFPPLSIASLKNERKEARKRADKTLPLPRMIEINSLP